jgi:hypothetical protein
VRSVVPDYKASDAACVGVKNVNGRANDHRGATAEDDALTWAAWAAKSATADEPLVFTGEGGEYFRIWVINTVLSIVTLGIYSAWAKFARRRTFPATRGCSATASSTPRIRSPFFAAA